jgi:hypothetical protein
MLKNEKISITIFFYNNMMMYIKIKFKIKYSPSYDQCIIQYPIVYLFSVREKHNNFYKISYVVIHSYLSHNRFSNGHGIWSIYGAKIGLMGVPLRCYNN